MIIILLKLILFFLTLFLAGWFFTVFILKEKRLFVLIPVSLSLGISFYLILVNTIAQFIPVNTAFNLVFFLFLGIVILSSFFYRHKPKLEPGISKKYLKYLILIAIFIALTGWLINVPMKEGDNAGISRAVLPGMILGGIFPVKDLLAPWRFGVFHYGFQLFSAAIDRVSGLPYWFADDVQIAIFAGLIFLLSFVLIYKITKKEVVAFWGSIVFFFCSGLNIFYIFKGIADLFRHYVFKEHIFAVWKFVGIATESPLRPTMMSIINLRWPALAFTAVLLIIYFYFKILESRSKKETIILSIVTGLLLGFLPLSGELYMIILVGTICTTTFLFIVFKHRKDKSEIFRHILAVLIILAISSVMFLYQGGVFTALKESGNVDKLSLSFDISESLKLEDRYPSPLNFFQDFFLNFGLGLFLLIPAIIYFRKNRKILFFIVPLIVISIVPLLFARFPIQSFERGLYLTEGFGYLLVGLLIITLITKVKKKEKIILYSLFLIIISGGIIFQIFNTIKTLAMPQRETFFTQPAAVELIDPNIKEWISLNTTPDDYFFAEIDDNLFSNLEERRYYFAQNLHFIAFYGRLAPIMFYQGGVTPLDIPAERVSFIQEAKTSCTARSLKGIEIKYIYFTEQWPKGLFEQCLENNNLELVFQSGENKIYKILNN